MPRRWYQKRMRDFSEAGVSGRTVIALDVDGVLNALTPEPGPSFMTVYVGRWPIRWRPEVIDRLRTLLLRPGVQGAWLTTWLEEPWLLDELEQVLGLDGMVPHRAAYPAVQTAGGASHIDPRFDHWAMFVPESPKWWKLRAAELLVESVQRARFAWVDDELGRSTRTPGDRWILGRTHWQFLLRPDPAAGLSNADLQQLEEWAGGGQSATDDVIRTFLVDLIAGLGPTLVAALSGREDRLAGGLYGEADGRVVPASMQKRLMCAHRVWRRVAAAEGEAVARLWFVAANPWLEGDTVVAAIRGGRLTQVSIAAQALVDDSWSG